MLTKEMRLKIASSYMERHNRFDPAEFAKEVRETGSDHPAYSWFTHDPDVALLKVNIIEARRFIRDLRIVQVVEVTKAGKSQLREVTTPAFVSPLEDHDSGGGYIENTTDEALEALRIEGLNNLEAWQRRYEKVLVSRGVPDKWITQIIGKIS